MIIIDANNLAGKLELLGEKNFDRLLIDLIKRYNQAKRWKIFLVFDSPDVMGDKFKEDNITAVYTPRDQYYRGADDKIIELAESLGPAQEIKVVTDDIEIKNAMLELAKKSGYRIFLEQATHFANKLRNFLASEETDNIEEGDLSEKEKENINKELLDIWK